MRLSEAIRLGAMSGGQVFGKLTDLMGGTCAQGAALLAAGLLDDAISGIDVRPHMLCIWPLLPTVAACPQCGVRDSVGNLMIHLNNDHTHNREQIADWVETIEKAQEPPVPACDSSDVTQEHAVATAVALCAPK